MCGIAGVIDFGARAGGGEPALVARAMADALAHRGPDDAGLWADSVAGVGLGHRRLSILDLSQAGHQPMASADGRHVLVYNGEIYNFAALRDELARAGRVFHGRSDTEVLVGAIERWGFARALERIDGMFAIAAWDRAERALCLARDRFGEKPLYYGVAGGSVVFASELKALGAHPRFEAKIDVDALTAFLRFGYVPTPASIFEGIRKLPPGTWLRVASERDVHAPPKAYWSLARLVKEARSDPFGGSEDDAADEVDRRLRASIRARTVSDVPVGAFLSGGIDSSTVVALMQAESTRPVRTFTIGFHERAYDEAESARAVARHLATDHTELYVTPDEARAVIPRLPALYDEPFADSSQIPTFLVAQLARRQVTVALSGDGGDELFGGYNRYLWAERSWRLARRAPRAARLSASWALLSVSPATWDALFRRLGERLPAGWRQRTPGDKLQKLGEALRAADEHDFYVRLASTWKDPERAVRGGRERRSDWTRQAASIGLDSFSEQMMYADALTYLPDDILTKVDRATMAVGLEGRIPMLDPALASFAWRLPLSTKVRSGTGKRPLRRVLARYVPAELFERPKMGFGVPIDSWLRGPLRDWAEALLGESRLRADGFFDAAAVRRKWGAHLRGTRNHQHELWAVLMFQAWRAVPRAAATAPSSSNRAASASHTTSRR